MIGKKILIIDDDRNFCETLSDIFKESGYENIDVLHDGLELTANLEKRRPDVVILDIMMPHFGAVSAMDQINPETSAHHIPVLIVTGRKDLEHSFNSDENVHGCFIKPINALALTAKVAEILERAEQSSLDTLKALKKHLTTDELKAEIIALKKLVKQGDTRFYNVVGKSLDGAVVFDGSGKVLFDGNGKVLYVNPEAERLYGEKAYSLSEEGLNLPAKGGARQALEIITAENDIIQVEAIITEISWQGKPALLATLRNMTEHRKVEKQREQLVEQLTDSNNELEKFAYVCSHDLQEPLRIINSFSALLERHMSDNFELDDNAKLYLKFISDSSDRAQALISGILSYSRMDRDLQQPAWVDLNDLLEVIRNDLIENGGVTDNAIIWDELPSIRGNETQFYQLFQNLINNGLKYQEAGNKPEVHISVKSDEEYWTFAVKDNGIGIEARQFDKVFEVFKRLHRAEEYQGTGIGLAICKKIVARHEGEIWLESEKGKGTTFFFTMRKVIDWPPSS